MAEWIVIATNIFGLLKNALQSETTQSLYCHVHQKTNSQLVAGSAMLSISPLSQIANKTLE